MKFFDKKILGFLISIIFIVLIVHQMNISKTLEAFRHINILYVIVAVPIYYSAFLTRGYRWRVILADQNLLKLWSLVSSLFIGFTVNCLLPARMGELYRAHLFGKKENIKRSKVFASIVLERVFDGMILLFILLLLIVFFYSKPWLYKLACVAACIFVGGFIVLLIFSKYGNSEFFQNNIDKALEKLPINLQKYLKLLLNQFSVFIEGLNVFKSFKSLLIAFILSLIIWIIESSVVFLIVSGFGIHFNLISAIFVMCVTAFSTMIPAGPASIGPYQFGYILAMSVFNIPKEMAFAISIFNQFFTIIFITLAGLFFMWKDHINMKELETDMETS